MNLFLDQNTQFHNIIRTNEQKASRNRPCQVDRRAGGMIVIASAALISKRPAGVQGWLGDQMRILFDFDG